VALLAKGVPYETLERAPEDRILRWYAMVTEEGEIEGERVQSLLSQA
jgi:hypothetical protein